MATITQTVEETLTFTAKPPQKQMKLLLQEPPSDSNEKQMLGAQSCPPGCIDCKRMRSQLQLLCPPGCEECKKQTLPQPCPPDCLTCKKQNSKTIPLLFKVVGMIIAVLASYLIVSTDSHLYLVFWFCYSVLRRMMMTSKPRVKTE